MVSIIKRMKVLRGKLATLRYGLGAATIPPPVQRLSLIFTYSNAGGAMGARKFWHVYLPRIKYYNPELPIDVTRTKSAEESGPPMLTVHYSDATPPKQIPLKDKFAADICRQLMDVTKAKDIPLNPEDQKAATDYEELVKSRALSELQREARRKAKRDEKEREKMGGVL